MGRDEVHTVVTGWPGWRRSPGFAVLKGEQVSVYFATPTPSAILPALATRVLQVEWEPAARALAESWRDRIERMKLALDKPQPHLPGALRLPTDRQPKPHQLAALDAIRHLDYRALLADDMGLGKTATALWAAWEARAQNIVIICPVSVKWNWAREIQSTIGDAYSITIVDGPATQRAEQFGLAQWNFRHGLSALILNYDALLNLSDYQKSILVEILKHGFLICDESHYIKNPDAERTIFVRHRLAPAARDGILLLTGTPVRNYVDDLFSQVESLRPGTWVSYADFCNRHLDMRLVEKGKKKTMVPARSKRLSALSAVMNTIQIRRKKEECINLPEKIYTSPELSMDAKMKLVYRAMKDFARYELMTLAKEHGEDSIIWKPAVRTGALNAMMRCEQLAQGFVGGVPESLLEQYGKQIFQAAERIEDRPEELMFPAFAKPVWIIEAIDAILAQGGQPVVFSRFNGPLFWLRQLLSKKGVGVSFLHGGLKAADKDSSITTFQRRATQVMLCQVRMAEGFNLTSSQDVIFFGRDWSPAVNAQAEDRCHRIGQTGTVNIQIPLVRGTVDIFLDSKLRRKESDASNALASVTLADLLEALG